MTERRSARRYDLCLPVSVRLPSLGQEAKNGTTRDISTRGVYFVLDQEISTGSQFDFTLTLPSELTGDAEVFVCAHAKVIRVESRTEGGRQGVGIAAVIEKYDIIRDDTGTPKPH
jgi:hypothetical protein